MAARNLSAEITHLHAEICSALADPNRILILYALADRPRSVNDLVAEVGLSQSAASRHLKVLRERGLVRSVRQGMSMEYRLNDLRIIQALDLLRLVLRNSIAHRASLLEEQSQEATQEAR